MYDKKNIFAKIISKEIPADIIYEDDRIMAFKDISPLAPVHLLVIPKGEYIDFTDFIEKAKPHDISYFFRKLSEIGEANCGEHFRICSNNGAWAGQTVFHFHMHILGGRNLGGMIA